MMIIFNTSLQNRKYRRAIIVLGTGLVGGELANSLLRYGNFNLQNIAVEWDNKSVLRQQLRSVVECLNLKPNSRLDWVWAAGKAGFADKARQINNEMANFRVFLDAVVESQTGNTVGNDVHIHLISSAGGLFEGQQYVGPNSIPKPRRPYGKLKLQQEQLAQEYCAANTLHIYRLSSVYGIIRPGRRNGLVSVLVSNTLCQRLTFFNGRFDTLRDYVWAGDIAEFITGRILHVSDRNNSIFLLASGKPTSIFEMRTLVQHFTRRHAYIHCAAETTNAENITFSPSALPPDWSPSSLDINIGRIVADAARSGNLMQTFI